MLKRKGARVSLSVCASVSVHVDGVDQLVERWSTITKIVRVFLSQNDVAECHCYLKIAVEKLPPSPGLVLQRMLKMCTLFCLVDIKKRSVLISCVLFYFIFLNASSHLCFQFFAICW